MQFLAAEFLWAGFLRAAFLRTLFPLPFWCPRITLMFLLLTFLFIAQSRQ